MRQEQAETRKQLRELQRGFDQTIGAKLGDRFCVFEHQVAKRLEELAIRDERYSQQIIGITDSMRIAGVDVDHKAENINVNHQSNDRRQLFKVDEQQNQLGDQNQQS